MNKYNTLYGDLLSLVERSQFATMGYAQIAASSLLKKSRTNETSFKDFYCTVRTRRKPKPLRYVGEPPLR